MSPPAPSGPRRRADPPRSLAPAGRFGQLGLGDLSDRDALVPVPKLFGGTVKRVACGESHTVALTKGGHAYAWGHNAFGQVGGRGLGATVLEPVRVFEDAVRDDTIVGVAAGAHTTYAWTSAGAVLAMGDNSYGQLGNGRTTPAKEPVQIKVVKGLKVAKVVTGSDHTLLLTKDGHVYAWGRNTMGQLGLEGGRDTAAPTKLAPFADGGKVVGVAAGNSHSMFVTEDGSVYGVGDNSGGQIGPVDSRIVQVPTKIRVDAPISSIACGKGHTLAVGKGQVYGWGWNMYGQLGIGASNGNNEQKPSKVNLPFTAVSVLAGASTGFALSDKGDLFGWGKNNAGQLGIKASKYPKIAPAAVVSASAAPAFAQIAAGGYAYNYQGHSAAVLKDGSLYTWGWNAFGQLGLGDATVLQNVPNRNSWLDKHKVVQVATGQYATAAVTDAGALFTWGLNDSGHLGKGEFRSTVWDVPQRVDFLTPEVRVLSVCVGYGHMLALTRGGDVYSWGRNIYGQLGLGDHKDKASPQLVTHLKEEPVKAVVCGQYHSLALTAKGDVYGWGYNRNYELGVGDNMDRVLPQAIPTLSGKPVTEVYAGGYHSMALTHDGQLYSWGLNTFGQLGQSSSHAEAKTPTLVVVTTGSQNGKQTGRKLKVLTAAAGTWHSLAVAETGSLYSWGRCQYGQLGYNCEKSAKSVAFPRKVELPRKVAKVVAGAAHSFALTFPPS